MRKVVAGGLLALAAGCSGESAEEKAERNAALANYVPPFVLSRLDYGGVVERRFRRLDRNEDDKLTLDELPQRVASRRMEQFDRNGDGVLSNAEWSEGMLARFDAQDLNKDGTVTSDERERARAQQQEDLPTPAEEPASNAAADAGR